MFVAAAFVGAMLALAGTATAKPSCLGKPATIVSSKPKIVGTKAPDTIVALGSGAHTISGLGGNDRICGGTGDDRIDGGKGVDRLDGGDGNDSVTGSKGPDSLSGGAGDDYLDGAQGSDEIDGGEGNDTLAGDKGNDRLDGGDGNDSIDGGPGDDPALEGGDGTDTVIGGTGIDKADGGPGDGDVVRGDAGTDTLDGGPGARDIVSYESATRGGIVVSLSSGRATGDGHDTLAGFEDVVGSPQGDDISGDSGSNRLDGGVGDDKLDGAGGDNEAFGGPGSDVCTNFTAENSCGPEPGPPANATYVVLNQGLSGASLVVQGSYGPNDVRIANPGGNWAVSDNGAIAPGDGCAAQPGDPHTAICPSVGSLNLIVATGGSGDDGIAIDPSVPASVSVRINGNAGSDTLVGGGGADVLEAGENYNHPDSGNDTLVGNGGADVLYADPGADQIDGGTGDDLLVSSVATCQGHTFDGGPGNDTVSYARSSGVAMSMALGGTGGPIHGCGSPDKILGDNESLEGSDGPDLMIGDNGPNSFLGHLGADTFIGKGGDDFIDAVDGKRDKKIDCGGGNDDVLKDPADPTISC